MKTPKLEKKQTLRLHKVTIARLNDIQMRVVRVGVNEEPPLFPIASTDDCTWGCTGYCTDLSECCPTQTTGDTGITPNFVGDGLIGPATG